MQSLPILQVYPYQFLRKMQVNIEYIDMPEDIRDKYQYFTEANMDKLKSAGYTKDFYSLEKGVDDYVRNYLAKNEFY